MDDARANEVLDRLIEWRLVEEVGGEVRPTRRWVAKLQAAAEKLNQLHARHLMPQGNPLVLAVSHALANENLTSDEALHADAVRMLVTLELSRMPREKRETYGFGDAPL
ncbi:MAG TPA: hypothetical protein VHH36_03630 [Candidatus Thermoplasmatota archaeon]|nr:hypothetical protein [Candidatus Thermoplasmatota archaeon]